MLEVEEMIHKRPFVDDDSNEVACKHARQLDQIDQLAPIVPFDNPHQKHFISEGEGEEGFLKHQDLGKSVSDSAIEESNGTNKNFEIGVTGCFPNFLWINNGILEADKVSFFPEYFDHGNQLRALLQPDEVFSSVDYPFRKSVSIGPEHQAYVPDWDLQCSDASLNQLDKSDSQAVHVQSSSPDITFKDDYGEDLMGTCIIPMLELEVSSDYCCERAKGDCSCLDGGSIKCVRQHNAEARQKLMENLGEEIFEGLGFCEMGEDVVKKWTEEEEQAFHEVVLSNPVSLGRNFWDHLSTELQSRTKTELVSYYFNVFMLRKRAEQNRFDSLNIDSDNDEWQRTEAGIAEEDEDSVVESLTGQEAPASYQEDLAEDCEEYVEDEDEIGASKNGAHDDVNRVPTDEEYEGDVDDISGAHVGTLNDCSGNTQFKLFKGIPSNNGEDYDVQDNSCTSYEYQLDNIDRCGLHDMGTNSRWSSRG